jgi:hypothetical protein
MQFNKSVFENMFNIDTEMEAVLVDFDDEKFKNLEKLYEKHQNLRGDNDWKNVRNLENFELKTVEYDFGSRCAYYPVLKENYTNLQVSRHGIEIDDEGLIHAVKKFAFQSKRLDATDQLRISEINGIKEKVSLDFEKFKNEAIPEDLKALQKAFLEDNSKFVQLGMRSANLLHYYNTNGYSGATGYDINELTVKVCNKLNYNAQILNVIEKDPIDLPGVDLVVAYHLLERTPDPLQFLKRLSAGLDSGAQLHVEVTIEPGTPRIRYSHLYPFERGDLQAMLFDSGFIPVSLSNIPHPGGPEIERVFAIVR